MVPSGSRALLLKICQEEQWSWSPLTVNIQQHNDMDYRKPQTLDQARNTDLLNTRISRSIENPEAWFQNAKQAHFRQQIPHVFAHVDMWGCWINHTNPVLESFLKLDARKVLWYKQLLTTPISYMSLDFRVSVLGVPLPIPGLQEWVWERTGTTVWEKSRCSPGHGGLLGSAPTYGKSLLLELQTNTSTKGLLFYL